MQRVLIVDDDEYILAGLKRNLKNQFDIVTAQSGHEAIEIVTANGDGFAVVVVDLKMPEMDGIELLSHMASITPDTVRVMLTGNADLSTAVEAVNKGAIFRFLTKPCTVEDMTEALLASVRQYILIMAERELLEGTVGGTIKTLSDILLMSNSEAFARAGRLKELVLEALDVVVYENVWELELASMLSHLGLVTLPEVTLKKILDGRDDFTPPEKDVIARLAIINHDLVVNIPHLEYVAKILLYINKNYDGTGFPIDAVSGDDIPLASRILRIMNDFLSIKSWQSANENNIEELFLKEGAYDQALLTKLYKVMVDYAKKYQNTLLGDVYSLPLEKLEKGFVLEKDVVMPNGITILEKGQILTSANINKLHNFFDVFGLEQKIEVKIPAKYEG